MSDWSNANDRTTAPVDVVTVRNLTKAYHGHRAVDGVDLAVGTGEIVGLIGANDAGKTTTVECIQGLRRPDGAASESASESSGSTRRPTANGPGHRSAASYKAPGSPTGCGSARRYARWRDETTTTFGTGRPPSSSLSTTISSPAEAAIGPTTPPLRCRWWRRTSAWPWCSRRPAHLPPMRTSGRDWSARS